MIIVISMGLALARCEGGGSSRWPVEGLEGHVARPAIFPDSAAAAPGRPTCQLTCLHTTTSGVMAEVAGSAF